MENTQYQLVKEHLLKNGKITSWTAFEVYGITRLSHIIYLLRKNDYKINSINTTKKNRYGHKVTYSTYTLEGV